MYNTGILKSVEFKIPVICIGNIAVGGTGKTPHTEYIAELLKQYFKVAILSRGYKRESKGFRIASSSSNISEIGDEPLQIFRKYPDLMVTVDRDRVSGVKKILEAAPETEVILLDDGYQHRGLTPGLSILLSDFAKPFVRDHMMPYGTLRESFDNMYRADIILITKTPENLSPIQRRLIVKEFNKSPYQNLYFTSLKYDSPIPVFNNMGKMESHFKLSKNTNCGIVLIAGIANPQPFKEYLQKYFSEITHLSFPDHYKFRDKDILSITSAFNNLKSEEKYLFTTEKDAVRLQEFSNFDEAIRSLFYYIPVGIHFLNSDKEEFDNTIVEYVRKNKRNNRISEV
jgi:tetraacyldisaccharide 4'-kinase